MREEVIATISQDDAEITLEVALIHTDTNDACVELRHLVWAQGLGWHQQKTLRLEAQAAHALLRTLGQVRHQLVPGGNAASARKVIPFPGNARSPVETKRRAI